MKTKKNYFSRALVLMMAFMLVFTMMPSGMLGAAETAYASTTVEWAGAANANAENNNVKTTMTNPLADYGTIYEKWKNEIVPTTGTTAVYAGQTAIVGDYIYISSGNGLEKINKDTGLTEATLEGVGSSTSTYDYMAYDATSGLLFVADCKASGWSGIPSIKAVDLDTFTLVGELEGLNKLGTFHPIQVHGSYLFSNGSVFTFTYTDGVCTITEYDTIEGAYNWSSGAFVEASAGDNAGNTILYLASKDTLRAYCVETKTVIDTWKFTDEKVGEATIDAATYGAGVVYANGRVYFGYYKGKSSLTDGYMFSVKINTNGTFDITSEGSKIVKDSVQPTVCTPVVSNGRVYVAGQSGAISVYDADTLELIYVAKANDLYNKTSKQYDGGISKIQSNPILYRDAAAGKTYIYVQTYNVPGYIYCLIEEDEATSGALTRIATPSVGDPTATAGAYAMEQIAIDDSGNIYCYNEGGYLFCFAKADAALIALSASVGESAIAFTQAFDSQIHNYELAVPRDTEDVNFTFEATSGATVKINGTQTEESTYKFTPDFESGESDTLSIEVSKGDCVRTYNVIVRKQNNDTSISYAISNSNAAPKSAVAVTGTSTVIDSSTYSKPRVWVAAPENGTIKCEVVEGDDSFSVSDESSLFAKRIYFNNGIANQDIIKVTSTAEDGKTTATYYLVVSKDGTYTPIEKNVSVTITNKGELVYGSDSGKTLVADAPIVAKDLDNSCTVDVDEVLKAAHNAYYEGGAEAGYKSEYTSFGMSLNKLWGDTSGAFGYWLNDNSCWSLSDTVEEDARVKAFVYKDGTGWSDIYTFFENAEYNAKTGEEVTLTLNKSVWNTETYAYETSSFEGAAIKILKSNSTKNYTTDANGQVKLKFDGAGTYTIVASKADGSIVPSTCTVKVTKDGGTSTPPTITEGSKVSFTLRGDIRHDSDVDKKVHTLRDGGLTTWISVTKVEIEAGDTIGTVFRRVLDKNGFTYVGLDNNYISEITKPGTNPITLAERDNGPNSGWMYTVNGTHPLLPLNDFVLSAGDIIVFHYTDDYTLEEGSGSFGGGAAGGALMDGEAVDKVTTDKKTETTTAPTEVKVSEKVNADGTKEKVAEISISVSNQNTIMSQAKANKSKSIVLNVNKDAVGDASKAEIKLDKDFVEAIVKDTNATLTVKTPFGDKTYTQDELRTIATETIGSTVVLEIVKTNAVADEDTSLEKAKELVEKITLTARSTKTSKKSIKVTLKMDDESTAAVKELKNLGFTVKYKFYRSTKKASKYTAKVTKTSKTYTNTSGIKGKKYYYKARVQVFDKDGKLLTQTSLKQCKYASRTWSK